MVRPGHTLRIRSSLTLPHTNRLRHRSADRVRTRRAPATRDADPRIHSTIRDAAATLRPSDAAPAHARVSRLRGVRRIVLALRGARARRRGRPALARARNCVPRRARRRALSGGDARVHRARQLPPALEGPAWRRRAARAHLRFLQGRAHQGRRRDRGRGEERRCAVGRLGREAAGRCACRTDGAVDQEEQRQQRQQPRRPLGLRNVDSREPLTSRCVPSTVFWGEGSSFEFATQARTPSPL
jgi:hypothetical protein